jgi:hypothetical protein
MVTTQDRLSIPPIQYFWQLVKELVPPKLSLEEGSWEDEGDKEAGEQRSRGAEETKGELQSKIQNLKFKLDSRTKQQAPLSTKS